MTTYHREIHFEDYIVEQLAEGGWLVGEHGEYDQARALYPEDVIGWIQESQPEAWEKRLFNAFIR